MKPYYDHNGVTIYHGDCLEIIPTLGEFDCLITDPPYGIEGGNGGTSKKRGKGDYQGFEDTPDNIEKTVIKALFELSKWKTMALTPGFRCIDKYPSPDSFGAFVSSSSTGMQRFGYGDCQPIFFYGWHYLQGKRPEACWTKMEDRPEKNGHPCPKPEKSWSWLVDKVATSEMSVLDPFMGSGTTLRICKDRGIKCVGIEQNEEYCEIAANRMSQEVLPLTERSEVK